MCEPTTLALASLAISAATTVAGAVGARASADSQIKANDQKAAFDQNQINLRAAQNSQERAKQAQAERARMRVAAGESGVAGISVNALLMDSLFQQGQANATEDFNRKTGLTVSEMNRQSANTVANNSVPTGLEVGLSVAGNAADAYGTYKADQIRKGN